MEISNLTLSIDEGPKKGETFERKPGRSSSIRIGRIVRGNTIAIKDPSILQNHLIINFQSHLSHWAVTDLGASNGTTVNGAIIPPNAAFPLSDGDAIRIGETTLMSVKISAACLAAEPRTRRGRRAAADIVEGKRRMTTRASARLEERIKSEGEGMGESGVKAAKLLKGRRNVKEEERQNFERIEVLVDDGSSGNLSKDDALGESGGKPAKLLKRRRKVKPSTFVAMKDEEGESLEKTEVLVDDVRGRMRGKKDDVLGKVVVESKNTVHGFEDGEVKEEKADLVNIRGKKKGNRGGLSKRISRKNMVVKNSASGDGKKLSGSRKVMFRIEEVENDKDGMMMSRQSNKEEELTKSWSSFSEIRGIPNTTSKYREDRLINCHGTPFEARVERALNRRIFET